MERDPEGPSLGGFPGAGAGHVPASEFPMADDIDMDMDPELAAAIEASYKQQQTPAGIADEDDELETVLRLSRLEEEARRQLAGSTSELQLPPPEDEDLLMGVAGAGAAAATAPAPVPLEQGSPSRRASGAQDSDMAIGLRGGDSPHGASDVGDATVDHLDASHMSHDEAADQQLAAAIEASYAAQTEHGMLSNEEDLIQQALLLSQREEESRQRAALKEQQEQELQESILMDQMREQEEKKRRIEEEEALAQSLELERQRQELERQQQEAQEKEQAAKRARLPPEPPAGEPGRVDIQIRAPGGQRLRRAFRGTDSVGQVYDYVDLEPLVVVEALQNKAYGLVSTMPRKEYQDRNQSLADAGLQGQCALLIEVKK